MVHFFLTHLDLNYFPATFARLKPDSMCDKNSRGKISKKKKKEKKRFCHSTTWHILKNAVWFEHSKCTHIDRCSRLLSPSPANTEHTHTKKVVITGLEEWDKNSPFCIFSRTGCYFAFSSFLGSEKDHDRKQRWKDQKRMAENKRKQREGGGKRGREAEDMADDSWETRGPLQTRIPESIQSP